MAGLLAVVAFVVALIMQLGDTHWGDFNYVSAMLIGLAALALHSLGYLPLRRPS